MPILEIGRMTQILCFVENDQIQRGIGNGLIVIVKGRTIRHQRRDTPAVCHAQCVRELALLRLGQRAARRAQRALVVFEIGQ